ncbi:MAG: diphosphomevalonate/mevalonate 3,5-bisphosphate decarboxylase family protein [Bacteroidales bacterium]
MNNLSTTWQCPSNIAIVKYWGKKGFQLPANPSVSFTLSECTTTTTLRVYEHPGKRKPEAQVYLDGEYHAAFSQRVTGYLQELSANTRWLKDFDFEIETSNNFPHGAGIASSASAFGALALCLTTFEWEFNPPENATDEAFFRRASFLARIGSGSAARSVYGGWTVWGKTSALQHSDDRFAIQVNEDAIHPVFRNLHDAIIVVSGETKKVSSSAGHKLMDGHPYASQRYRRAAENTQHLIEILQKGDWETFSALCESEALDLHGLMMTSKPSYILLKPASLEWMERIRQAILHEHLPLTYTLDAGPNIHLIYPEEAVKQIHQWLDNQKISQQNPVIIYDRLGLGPQKKL